MFSLLGFIFMCAVLLWITVAVVFGGGYTLYMNPTLKGRIVYCLFVIGCACAWAKMFSMIEITFR